MPEPASRVYAYPVVPEQDPGGGEVRLSSDVSFALDEAYRKAKVDEGLAVAFRLAPERRSNDVRDALMAVAFPSSPADADESAAWLAARLATSMDLRSKPTLLVVSVHGEAADREVVLWTFPRDEAFRYASRRGRDLIEVVDDVFSRTSILRKAAAFAGRQTRSGFLSGRVVDFQSNSSDRYVADFWLDRFLEARLQMSGREGTTLFAKAVRQALGKLEGDADATQVLADAIVAVRHRTGRLSIEGFANDYLREPATTALLESAPNREAGRALFEFDAGVFERQLRFRIYRLATGASVAVPLDAEDAVELEEVDGVRFLEARGEVVSEALRSRRG